MFSGQELSLTQAENTVSDFVRKLEAMLDDPTVTHIVSWGPTGETFVVKDMPEFSKTILPKYFKHNNFASFVRQLNKYDFHKTKSCDERKEDWEFQHDFFKYSNRELLKEIRRKATKGIRTSNNSGMVGMHGDTQDIFNDLYRDNDMLKLQINDIRTSNIQISSHLSNLDMRYQELLSEVGRLKETTTKQEEIIRNLLDILAKQGINTLPEISQNPTTFNYGEIPYPSGSTQVTHYPVPNIQQPLGMQYYSPRPLHNNNEDTKVGFWAPGQEQPNTTINQQKPAREKHIPKKQNTDMKINWKHAPRVLVVDDDQVYQRLYSKYLAGLGCYFDVVGDGHDAVECIRGGKNYDIVLMDILMPFMDGCSATSQIRSQGCQVPIISVTSAITEEECLRYIRNGMTDIMAKPYHLNTLWNVIKKYCAHLENNPMYFNDGRTLFINPSVNVSTYSGDPTASIRFITNVSGNSGNRIVELNEEEEQEQVGNTSNTPWPAHNTGYSEYDLNNKRRRH